MRTIRTANLLNQPGCGRGMEQEAGIAFTHGYIPWSVGLGAAFDLIKPPSETPKGRQLSLVGTALWSDWQQYRDRHNESAKGSYAWSRTISPSVGVRYSDAGWGTMLDLTFVPSPVPLQTGRTNYVDNDRIGLNTGAQYLFSLAASHFRVGVEVQAHHLFTRYQRKIDASTQAPPNGDSPSLVVDEVPDDAIDNAKSGQPAAGRTGLQTNNPGWPGFSSGGWIFAGGAHLALLFK